MFSSGLYETDTFYNPHFIEQTFTQDLLTFISVAVFLAIPLGSFLSWWKNLLAGLPSTRPEIIVLGLKEELLS
jgi:hypothetical protein